MVRPPNEFHRPRRAPPITTLSAMPLGEGALESILPGLHAWVQRPHGHDAPNAGVIVDEGDGITVVDTLLVPSQSARAGRRARAIRRAGQARRLHEQPRRVHGRLVDVLDGGPLRALADERADGPAARTRPRSNVCTPSTRTELAEPDHATGVAHGRRRRRTSPSRTWWSPTRGQMRREPDGARSRSRGALRRCDVLLRRHAQRVRRRPAGVGRRARRAR